MGKVFVTKTFLPPIEEYQVYLNKIWSSSQLTNQGPLLKEFEAKAKEYLGVKDFHLVTNGTLALDVSLRALDILEGEVITTPFTYVATTSSILWERCDPVYVDIEPDTYCIDTKKIEAAITEKTVAILPVHIFGNPCDVEAIEAIAKRHNLKVIYDAAHAFGVKYKGRSILEYGDVSTLSFHATKLFHTIEGGGIVVRSPQVSEKVELIKRFGHNINDDHHMLGTNAKASELQAAMGLCNLKYVDELIIKRKKICELYDGFLIDKLKTLKIKSDVTYNYAYYPVVFKNEEQLLKVLGALNSHDIFPRRYFYPSLNTLPYIESSYSCPVSEGISRTILCLPLYADLESQVVAQICKIILETLA